MIGEPEYNVCSQMQVDGLLATLDETNLDAFLQRPGLQLLFFAGPHAVRREAHDVAVALREFLREYAGSLEGACIATEAESALQPRFRVTKTPCLVLVTGGEVLELIPGVRDWAEYAEIFQRYLGTANQAMRA
ncbi:MAG: hypothetical protein Cons2KO_12260 [Congregibacter sp.]